MRHRRFLLLILLIPSVVNYPSCAFAFAMRAWTCHGRNQKELVDKLRQARIISSPEVQKVMEMVDRQHFCPSNPHADAPQSIGLGQTISAPHMHAHVLEEMLPYLKKTKSNTYNLLDVGCGSGYLTACMGEWVHPPNPLLQKTGTVFGIDVWADLVERATQNIQKHNPDLISKETLKISKGDGWKGLNKGFRFDAIHVGAAADDFPQPLLMQLKVGGVLIIPVGPEGGVQTLFKVERLRENNRFDRNDFIFFELLGVRYVPLVRP